MEIPRKRKRGGEKTQKIFGAIVTEDFPKLMSDTTPGSSENTKQDKCKNKNKQQKNNKKPYTQAYHIRTAKNQIKWGWGGGGGDEEISQRRKINLPTKEEK